MTSNFRVGRWVQNDPPEMGPHQPNQPLQLTGLNNLCDPTSSNRECVSMGAAGAQTRRYLGHYLLHPLILRLLVLGAPAVLRSRALQDAPAPADPNS